MCRYRRVAPEPSEVLTLSKFMCGQYNSGDYYAFLPVVQDGKMPVLLFLRNSSNMRPHLVLSTQNSSSAPSGHRVFVVCSGWKPFDLLLCWLGSVRMNVVSRGIEFISKSSSDLDEALTHVIAELNVISSFRGLFVDPLFSASFSVLGVVRTPQAGCSFAAERPTPATLLSLGV